MNPNPEEYGGYLPLELPEPASEYHERFGSMQLRRYNSGRATFYFAAKQAKASRVFLPYFNCPDIDAPFLKLGIKVERYFLDEDLKPRDITVGPGDLLVWTNYYGNARQEIIDTVVEVNHGRVIVDNCHAFFSPPASGAFNSYSARKFLGVSDGAYLLGESLEVPYGVSRDTSYGSISHLARQIEQGVNSGYPESLANEIRLLDNYSVMSEFTQRVLSGLDYSIIQEKRVQNFLRLHSWLGPANNFSVNLSSQTQMFYPFLHEDSGLRSRLVQKKLYSPTLWSHVIDLVPESSIEALLSRNMVLLPIDQRYDLSDMDKIATMVIGEIE